MREQDTWKWRKKVSLEDLPVWLALLGSSASRKQGAGVDGGDAVDSKH